MKHILLLSGMAAVLLLSACDSSPEEAEELEFASCSVVREHNHTLIFTGDALAELAVGDVLYVVTADSLCAGKSDPYGGNSFAVTVWGDDEMTEEKDGLESGEPFLLILSSSRFEQPQELEPSVVEGPATYQEDGLTVVSGFEP